MGLVWNAKINQWACPTDVCGALCCTQDPWAGARTQPCRFLLSDKLCELEKTKHDGLVDYKPGWCRVWPRNQDDVDRFNRGALEEYGPEHPQHGKQCQLKFEEDIPFLQPPTPLPWPGTMPKKIEELSDKEILERINRIATDVCNETD